MDGPRPCPHLRCRQHLWLHAGEDRPGRRGIERSLPEARAWARTESCTLDVADRVEHGELTLDEIGDLLGVSRERTRQLEVRAQTKLRARLKRILDDE